MKTQSALCTAVLLAVFGNGSPVPCRAQDFPGNAGNLDTSFFAANRVVPGWYDGPTVRRLLVQLDGRVLLCGTFTHVQHRRSGGLARLHAAGAVDDTFVPGVETVNDVVLQPDGRIVVAAECGLARVDSDGAVDRSFDGQIAGGATSVACLPDGRLVAGIQMDNDPADSAPRYGVALYDTSGRLVTTWSSAYRTRTPVSWIAPSPSAKRVILDGGVEVSLEESGGNFHSLTNILPEGFRVVCAAFQPDGKLLLGGGAPADYLSATNAFLPHALARLKADNSLDPAFQDCTVAIGDLDSAKHEIKVAAISVQEDGRILIGGFFTKVNGEPRSIAARLLPDGRLDSTFKPDLEVNPWWDIDALQNVSAMALTHEHQLLIAGVFSRCNGLECHSVARLHTSADTGGGILRFAQDTYYAWETNGPIQVVVNRYGPANSEVSVAYEAVGLPSDASAASSLRGILRFAAGESSRSFTWRNPDNLIAEGNRSFHFLLSNPTGGAALTGTPEARIVLLDDESYGRPGSVDLEFPAIFADETVQAVTLLAIEPDGSALVSVFTQTGVQDYSPAMLRVLPDGRIDPAFHPVFDQFVSSAFPEPATGEVVVAGGFSTVNGQRRSQLARLRHDGSLAPGFSISADGWISGVTAAPDGGYLIFGYFRSINEIPRVQLAWIDHDGTVNPGFDTSALPWIGTLASVACQSDGKVVIGGQFDQVGGLPRTNLVRLDKTGSVDPLFNAESVGSACFIRSILGQPDGKLLVSGALQQPDGSWRPVMRLQSDGSVDPTFCAETSGYGQGWPLVLQPDGKLLLDGASRLNVDGSRDYSFLAAADSAGVTGAALLPNGDVLISGDFKTFEEWPRPRLVRVRGGSAEVFGFFEFAEPNVTVPETVGAVMVHIRRRGPFSQPASVRVRTLDDTAVHNADYSALDTVSTFAPGVTEQTLSIPINTRSGYQGNRYLQVTIEDQTGGLRSPSGQPISICIEETSQGVGFSRPAYWVERDSITTTGEWTEIGSVRRQGDLACELTVYCNVIAGSAVAGEDFVDGNIPLQFPQGISEIPVLIPLLTNEAATADRTLLLTLNAPDSGWCLSGDATAVLTICGKRLGPAFVASSATSVTNGSFHILCDTPLAKSFDVESSIDLVNWSYLGYVYRENGRGPVAFEDPDAWKYAQRYYRLSWFGMDGLLTGAR